MIQQHNSHDSNNDDSNNIYDTNTSTNYDIVLWYNNDILWYTNTM